MTQLFAFLSNCDYSLSSLTHREQSGWDPRVDAPTLSPTPKTNLSDTTS